MAHLLIFAAIIVFPWPMARTSLTRWIVWNVGQGEWVTHVSGDVCDHFDMGGEKWPREAIRLACADKVNRVFFSHWDMDHVGFASRARAVLPRLCLGQAPLGSASPRKQALLDALPACPDSSAFEFGVPKSS